MTLSSSTRKQLNSPDPSKNLLKHVIGHLTTNAQASWCYQRSFSLWIWWVLQHQHDWRFDWWSLIISCRHQSNSKLFWSEVEGAAAYDASLKKKAEKNPKKYGDSRWEDDHTEKSHMVWEWRCVEASRFNYFFKAAHPVALVPISSETVEHVFSQVKFIIETTGVSVLEESLETGVMERVNHYPNRIRGH